MPLPRYQVLVRQQDGEWLDLCAVPVTGGGTENRVLGWRISDSVTDAVAGMELELALNTPAGSLAPLALNSPLHNLGGNGFSPALNMVREIRVRLDETGSGDWVDEFHGIIDKPRASHRVDASGRIQATLSVPCRDKAALLLHQQIEDQEPVPAGTMEDVMQHILDRWTAPGRWPLVVEGTPEFGFEEHEPEAPQPILEHLRNLAHIRGWSIRWRQNATTGLFALTLFQVDRDFDPDEDEARFQVAADEITDVPETAVDWTHVRNRIRLRYFSGGVEQPSLLFEDLQSQEVLGPPGEPLILFGELVEGDESPIDTEPEALAYLTAAGKDLSLPGVEKQARIGYNPWLRVGDYLEFAARPGLWDEPQYLAVAAFERAHRMQPDGRFERYTLPSLRGRATGGLADFAAGRPQVTVPVVVPPHLIGFEEFYRDDQMVGYQGWTPSAEEGYPPTAFVSEVVVAQREYELPVLDPWPHDHLDEIAQEIADPGSTPWTVERQLHPNYPDVHLKARMRFYFAIPFIGNVRYGQCDPIRVTQTGQRIGGEIEQVRIFGVGTDLPGGQLPPTVTMVLLFPPPIDSSTMLITTACSRDDALYTRIIELRSFDPGTGWTAWDDITGDVTPITGSPPADEVASDVGEYEYSTPWPHVADTLDRARVQVRVSILDAEQQVVSQLANSTVWTFEI